MTKVTQRDTNNRRWSLSNIRTHPGALVSQQSGWLYEGTYWCVWAWYIHIQWEQESGKSWKSGKSEKCGNEGKRWKTLKKVEQSEKVEKMPKNTKNDKKWHKVIPTLEDGPCRTSEHIPVLSCLNKVDGYTRAPADVYERDTYTFSGNKKVEKIEKVENWKMWKWRKKVQNTEQSWTKWKSGKIPKKYKKWQKVTQSDTRNRWWSLSNIRTHPGALVSQQSGWWYEGSCWWVLTWYIHIQWALKSGKSGKREKSEKSEKVKKWFCFRKRVFSVSFFAKHFTLDTHTAEIEWKPFVSYNHWLDAV
jgi:hypothetical protein